MSESASLSAFVDKWRARWPEWTIAEVFVPTMHRETASAWFALRQELLDAAWSGADPTPGQAKLAWWTEELHGWTLGRRRHPLGMVLQRHRAPWTEVALATRSLASAREQPPRDEGEAAGQMQAFAVAATAVDAALFAPIRVAAVEGVESALLFDQLLLRGEAAVPLQVRAGAGVGDTSAPDAWAQALARRWARAPGGGSPSLRVLAALQRERLRRAAIGAPPSQALGTWPALWTAWRGARG